LRVAKERGGTQFRITKEERKEGLNRE